MAGTSGSSLGMVAVSEQGSGISAVERVRRQDVVDRARHSTEMEGGSVSPETEADLARYVAGEIDSEQLEALEDVRLAREIAAARAAG